MSDRILTNDFVTELTADSIKPFFLVSLTFTSSTLRLSTLQRDITWDSVTWYGNGWLHGIDPVVETQDLEAQGAIITLAGVPESIISLVLDQVSQGNLGKIYLGFLNSSNAVINSPYEIFRGYLDVPTIKENPQEPVIEITLESILIDLQRSKEGRYNNEHQQIYYPEDTGFRFVKSAAAWSGFWGNEKKEVKKKKRGKKNNKRK